jgi:hypothetical protein
MTMTTLIADIALAVTVVLGLGSVANDRRQRCLKREALCASSLREHRCATNDGDERDREA